MTYLSLHWSIFKNIPTILWSPAVYHSSQLWLHTYGMIMKNQLSSVLFPQTCLKYPPNPCFSDTCSNANFKCRHFLHVYWSGITSPLPRVPSLKRFHILNAEQNLGLVEVSLGISPSVELPTRYLLNTQCTSFICLGLARVEKKFPSSPEWSYAFRNLKTRSPPNWKIRAHQGPSIQLFVAKLETRPNQKKHPAECRVPSRGTPSNGLVSWVVPLGPRPTFY